LITLRPLLSHQDLLACVELQREVWGEDFQECVAPTLLKVTQKIGGIAAGAFDETGELLGFVYGMTGIRSGRPVHWSHMLGVRPSARGHGIGQLLKEHQRRVCRELQVETIFWTFDPLAAGNAYLNLNRLGAKVVEYVPDMYPPTGSPLHGTVATDRFIVAWETSGRDGGQPNLENIGATFRSIPLLDGNDGGTPGEAADLDGSNRPALLRTPIPSNFEALLAEDSVTAERWRLALRHAITRAMDSGYSVVGVWPDAKSGVPHYIFGDTTTKKGDLQGSGPNG